MNNEERCFTEICKIIEDTKELAAFCKENNWNVAAYSLVQVHSAMKRLLKIWQYEITKQSFLFRAYFDRLFFLFP